MLAAWRLLAALILVVLTATAALAEAAADRIGFGAFTLPSDKPYAIELADVIGDTSPEDFAKALVARPDARVLLLASPGGFVDKALIIAAAVRARGMATLVPDGAGCFSACAYIYFAGTPRQVRGALGVHQIDTEIDDLVFAQNTLSDILDAFYMYGVQQAVVSHMLRTPPTKMYVFSPDEIRDWGINAGDPVQLAGIDPGIPVNLPGQATATMDGGVTVHLVRQSSRADELALPSKHRVLAGVASAHTPR